MEHGIGKLYDRDVAKGRLRADPAQRAVLPLFEAIGSRLARRPGRRGLFGRPAPPPKGLYLWGGVGRGKSMLMDMFAGTVPADLGHRAHFHAFMQEVHAGMHQARRQGVKDALRPVAERLAARVRLFCFDEMQIADITDAMLVGRLFGFLFKAGVVVVTTSNQPPDELYRDGLNRQLFLPFIGLLKANMAVHELAGLADYRQHRLVGAHVCFIPADGAARAAINALWRDLTGGAGEPLILTVKGRKVVLPGFRNGVARASFRELCVRSLGPADYLAVAGAVKMLILEDVPRLSSGQYNEARRFMTLIDALYEARVRLVISAAAAPGQLYPEGGEGFARTASRLQEMLGTGWGGRK